MCLSAGSSTLSIAWITPFEGAYPPRQVGCRRGLDEDAKARIVLRNLHVLRSSSSPLPHASTVPSAATAAVS
jgi:hypothetical protein